MFKRVDHVEILTRDARATIRFYVDVLGFRVLQEVPVPMSPMRGVAYLGLGDTMIEVLDVEGPDPRSDARWQVGYKALALEVEDMDAAVEHLQSHGISMSVPPVDLGDSFRGEFVDPDGLAIELRQWKTRIN